MALPQLMAKDPRVVPAQDEQVIQQTIPASEEKVYNKYWMKNLVVSASNPTKEARIVATLVPARDVDVDGTTVKELMPDAEPVIVMVNNVFERAASDVDFATAIGAVLNAVIDIGQEQGVIEL